MLRSPRATAHRGEETGRGVIDLRGAALRVTADHQDPPIVQERCGVPKAGGRHRAGAARAGSPGARAAAPEPCARVMELRGTEWKGGPEAAGDQHLAVREANGGVIAMALAQSARRAPGAAGRVVELGAGGLPPGGEGAAVVEQREREVLPGRGGREGASRGPGARCGGGGLGESAHHRHRPGELHHQQGEASRPHVSPPWSRRAPAPRNGPSC